MFAGAGLLRVPLHDVVDLLQLVGQPLLAAELVLLQCDDQLLVVLHCVPEISEDYRNFQFFQFKIYFPNTVSSAGEFKLVLRKSLCKLN